MKKIFLGILSVLIIVIFVLFFNYFTIQPKLIPSTGDNPLIPNITGTTNRLSEAITFKTVSFEESEDMNFTPFLEFQEFLKRSFPKIYKNLEIEVVNHYSLLFHWKGKNKALKPIILMGHIDVVPVLDDTKELWTVPPFDGVIKDDYLYGRGAMDCKSTILAQMEAVNFLLEHNFQPERDIYLAYGHDEEITGENGAPQIAQLLKSRGVSAEFVLDEGGIITKIPGIKEAVAIVGTSEKGFLDLALKVKMEGGHSSMPNEKNAIKVLSKAITDLMNKPFKPKITASTGDFIEYTTPYYDFSNKMILSNQWIFKSLLFKAFEKDPGANAMIRTTMVPTIISGGEKSNVIPYEAMAMVNYRLLSGETIEDVIEHTKKAINNPEVTIEKVRGFEASSVSPSKNISFNFITEIIQTQFPKTIVSPYLVVGATDSRHYSILSSNIYRFSPISDNDAIGMHGVNERINLKAYSNMISFYITLIKSLNKWAS